MLLVTLTATVTVLVAAVTAAIWDVTRQSPAAVEVPVTAAATPRVAEQMTVATLAAWTTARRLIDTVASAETVEPPSEREAKLRSTLAPAVTVLVPFTTAATGTTVVVVTVAAAVVVDDPATREASRQSSAARTATELAADGEAARARESVPKVVTLETPADAADRLTEASRIAVVVETADTCDDTLFCTSTGTDTEEEPAISAERLFVTLGAAVAVAAAATPPATDRSFPRAAVTVETPADTAAIEIVEPGVSVFVRSANI